MDCDTLCDLSRHTLRLSDFAAHSFNYFFFFVCARAAPRHPLRLTPTATAHRLRTCKANVSSQSEVGQRICCRGAAGILRCKWPPP